MNEESSMPDNNELKQELDTVKCDLVVQTATQAGAQATQAATQAGAQATQAAAVVSGAVAFVVGLFLGMTVINSK